MSRPKSRVSRVLMKGPLAPFADAYRAELERRGYTPLSTVNALRQVGRLSLWLEAGGHRASELSEEKVERFLASQRAAGRHRSQWSRPGLACLLEVLRALGTLAAEEPVPARSPVDLLLASFERYLLVERGLAAGTVRGYLAHARSFLDVSHPGFHGDSERRTFRPPARRTSANASTEEVPRRAERARRPPRA